MLMGGRAEGLACAEPHRREQKAGAYENIEELMRENEELMRN